MARGCFSPFSRLPQAQGSAYATKRRFGLNKPTAGGTPSKTCTVTLSFPPGASSLGTYQARAEQIAAPNRTRCRPPARTMARCRAARGEQPAAAGAGPGRARRGRAPLGKSRLPPPQRGTGSGREAPALCLGASAPRCRPSLILLMKARAEIKAIFRSGGHPLGPVGFNRPAPLSSHTRQQKGKVESTRP